MAPTMIKATASMRLGPTKSAVEPIKTKPIDPRKKKKLMTAVIHPGN